MTDNQNSILKFKPKTVENGLPEACANTGGYPLVSTLYSPVPLEKVHDIARAATRNRRWGATLSIAVVPDLDASDGGPVIVSQPPHKLFDADDIEQLRARLIYEIDQALNFAKLAKEDPEEFERQYNEMMGMHEIEEGK